MDIFHLAATSLLLLDVICHCSSTDETPHPIPYSVRTALKNCQCRNGGVCFLKPVELRVDSPFTEEIVFNGRTFVDTRLEEVETGTGCHCQELSNGYFSYESDKDTCIQLVNHCKNATCHNGGQCVNKFGYFYCRCPEGWGGQTCALKEIRKRKLGNSKPRNLTIHPTDWIPPKEVRFAKDITIIWNPNTDFQFTADNWFKISMVDTGIDLQVWMKFLDLYYYIPVGNDTVNEKLICRKSGLPRSICSTYGHENYKTATLSWKRNFYAPYNLLFGEQLEKALRIPFLENWPWQIYAVKYPPITIQIFNGDKLTFSREFTMWSQITAQYSSCLPKIKVDGCSADARHPKMYLPEELVQIHLSFLMSPSCKRLTRRLRDAVFFFQDSIQDRTPLKSRSKTKQGKHNIEWVNQEKMTFRQEELYYFDFKTLWVAVFPLEFVSSVISVEGDELPMVLDVMCFFKIAPPHTEVFVGGGSRTVSCGQDLELVPVNTNPVFGLNDFRLIWSCDDDKNPNSEVCGSIIVTSWEKRIIKSDQLECNHVYKFKLTPLHKYFQLTSPTKTYEGPVFRWTITTEIGATEVKVFLMLPMQKINPEFPILLEATESAVAGGPPVWNIYEETSTTRLTPLIDYSDFLDDKWHFLIKQDMLNRERQYRIEALTSRGKSEIVIETNSPPGYGTCSISPSSGTRDATLFNVTCAEWEDDDPPLMYTVGVVRYGVFQPIVRSNYPETIPPISLHYDSIYVSVQDRFGMGTLIKLDVELQNGDIPYNFSEQMKTFEDHVISKDYDSMMNWMIQNSNKASGNNSVTSAQKAQILEKMQFIIPHTRYLEDLGVLGLSISQLMETYHKLQKNDTQGIHEMVLLAGKTLHLAADRIEAIINDNQGQRASLGYYLGAFDINSTVSSLVAAANDILHVQNTNILPGTKTRLGLQAVYKSDMKVGILATIQALHVILAGIRDRMPPGFKPFELAVGLVRIFTAVGRSRALQGYLVELEDSKVILSSEMMEYMGENGVYAVQVVFVDKDCFTWDPTSGDVMDVKFFAGPGSIKPPKSCKFEEMEMDLGSFPVYVKARSTNFSTVKGIARKSPLEQCGRDCNLYMSVHQFKLPPGPGVVVIDFDQKHVGKIKVFAKDNYFPEYSEVEEQPPLMKRHWRVKYVYDDSKEHLKEGWDDKSSKDLRDPSMVEKFYIAFNSVNQLDYHYDFNVTIYKCVYYISAMWQSYGCEYKNLIKDRDGNYTIQCHCSHLSMLSVSIFPPTSVQAAIENFLMWDEIKDHFHVAVLVISMMTIWLIALIWAWYRDYRDFKKRSAINLYDNYPGDTHPYVLVVFTGKRCKAGTTSKVGFRVVGSAASSRTHILKAKGVKTLSTASDDWFLLYAPNYLGKIKEIYLWHNHHGGSADWYCEEVTVFDLLTKTPYNFIVRRWFTVSEDCDDSQVFRATNPTQKWMSELDSMGAAVGSHFTTALREKHMWGCIITRHPRSEYSRAQRVAILGTILFGNLVITIMFFDIEDVEAADLPTITVDLDAYFKAMQGAVVGMLLGFLTIFAFSLSKPTVVQERAAIKEKEEDQFAPATKPKRARRKIADRRGGAKSNALVKMYKKWKAGLTPTYLPVTSESKLRQIRKAERGGCKTIIMKLLAWTYGVALMFAMSYFVVWKGLKFGPKKSVLFMQSFLTGLITDAFFLNPFRMFITALLVAYVFKEAPRGDLVVDVDYDATDLPYKDYGDRLDRMWLRLKPEYKMMPCFRIQKLAERKVTVEFYKRYIGYMLFLCTLAALIGVIIVSLHTDNSYSYGQTVRAELSERGIEDGTGLRDIHSKDDLADYVNQTLLRAIHRHKWYNGKWMNPEPSEDVFEDENRTLKTKGVLLDYNSKLIGVPRYRQQRISPSAEIRHRIAEEFRDNASTAIGRLGVFTEDFHKYLIGWKTFNRRFHGRVKNLWEYQFEVDTVTALYAGKTGAWYAGRGYVQFMYWSQEKSEELFFINLKNNWIDNRTRVHFIEIDLYNANLNLFVSVVVLAELLPSNVCAIRILMDVGTLMMNTDPYTTVTMICGVILLILVLGWSIYYFTYSAKLGVVTSLSTWRGLIDGMIIFCTSLVALHIFNQASQFEAFADKLDKSPRDQFIPLYSPFYVDLKYRLALGLFIMVVTAAYSTAIHQVLGYGRFKWVFIRLSLIMMPICAYILALDQVMLAAIKTRGEEQFTELGMVTFAKEPPFEAIMELSRAAQLLSMLFFFGVALLTKFILGGLIYFHSRAAEELGTKTFGLAKIARRKKPDPFDKQLGAMERDITKKLDDIDKKIEKLHKNERRNLKQIFDQKYPPKPVKPKEEKPSKVKLPKFSKATGVIEEKQEPETGA